MENTLTPARIVKELDKYIIGQAEAKKAVAIALRNRWRRLNAREDIRKEIIPNNIMMIGPTGVGKTEVARRLAQLAQAPFVKVEASKFTEVGYVGRDVESMIRDLVEQAVNMVRAEQKEQVRAAARETADELILDILIPPVAQPRPTSPFNREKSDDIGYKSAQVESYSDSELNERTREKFREKLKNGELEDRKIEVEVTMPSHNVQVVGPMGMDGMDGLQDMLSGMIPKKKKNRKMTVAEAREHFVEEEASRMIDMDSVTRDAIERASNSGIVFIDEVDKVAVSAGAKGGPDVSRQGVQRDLLPIVEGSVVNTKHGSIKTDHILFIAAGAFHVAKPSDLIPELQGRFPIRVELNSLTKEDFVKILTQPRNALTKQYQALLESEEIELQFEEPAIDLMAEMAFSVNQEVENIGARRLHTIMSNLLQDILFDVPDNTDTKSFTVTRDFVESKLSGMVHRKDLSQYIL
ncbi:ATP-dependent protease ATPase subunit HslU [Pontibacter sp. G13]|uniref:ATP-dependent protease ATPase subunit HslU n=1 Tax=Pontibacter sp. G13 TaxID=3074898 RepID=UPI00288BCDE1|nr:ATP-dependent protease ATPase subunit HslU [Pontibacter sp. G13]WNJ20823.1 ATP-dependent protease ATPase subunit HslU [Pontibacter sp. G13]